MFTSLLKPYLASHLLLQDFDILTLSFFSSGENQHQVHLQFSPLTPENYTLLSYVCLFV